MELSDKKCVICSLVLQEAIRTTCGHFLCICRDCFIMRENGPRRCPVDDLPLTESESIDGGQGCVLSYNIHPAESVAGQGVCVQNQEALGCQANDEQGGGPSPYDEQKDHTVSQRKNGEEQQPSYQEGDGQQVNGWRSPVTEVEHSADQTVYADEGRSGHHEVNGRRGSGADYSMMNGAGASDASLPIQETQPVSDQLVNGQQQQIRHQQEGGPLANGLNHRTHEADPHASQRVDRPDYQPPLQEAGADQGCECNFPVQETGQGAVQLPDEHEELPSGLQQIADVNGVSSTGQTEQAVEHNCSRQELRLWNQKLDRSNPPQKATRNKINPRETFFIEEISEVQQHCRVDANGVATAFFSSAIYTDRYDYKLGVRVHLNGVGTGSGRFVAVFIHMMTGKYDNLDVIWPFNQRITLSILDQSGAKCHISQTIQAKPNMSAFQKPTESICPTGCGFVKFASIEEVFSPPYVKDDKLFLKIKFSS